MKNTILIFSGGIIILCVLVINCGVIKNPDASEPMYVVSLGYDISQTAEIKNLPIFDARHLDEILEILSHGPRTAELGLLTIGNSPYPRLEHIRLFDVVKFDLDKRGALARQQRQEIARFRNRVIPRLSSRNDAWTFFHHSLQKLKTFLQEPRLGEVQPILVVISDFEPSYPPEWQAKAGLQTGVFREPIGLASDVWVFVVADQADAAQRFFSGPTKYFVDCDRLLGHLRILLEKKS